jgi:hypothetical protein
MFFTIKNIGQMLALVVIVSLFFGCSEKGVSSISGPVDPVQTGDLKVNIDMGKVGQLAKLAKIKMARVMFCYSRPGISQHIDTIALLGGNKDTIVTKVYTLSSGYTYDIGVFSEDTAGRRIHSASASAYVSTGVTTPVNITSKACYSTFPEKFFPMPDSANKAEVYITSTCNSCSPFQLTDSLVFAKGSRHDTVSMSQDVPLMNFPSASSVTLRFRIYGDNGAAQKGIVLFQADTTVSVNPSEDMSCAMTMKQVGGYSGGNLAVNANMAKVATIGFKIEVPPPN